MPANNGIPITEYTALITGVNQQSYTVPGFRTINEAILAATLRPTGPAAADGFVRRVQYERADGR